MTEAAAEVAANANLSGSGMTEKIKRRKNIRNINLINTVEAAIHNLHRGLHTLTHTSTQLQTGM